MSITCVNEESIAAHNDAVHSGVIESSLDLIEKAALEVGGPITGADLLEYITVHFDPKSRATFWTRLEDARKEGLIRKTGTKLVSVSTGKKGAAFEYVRPSQRISAILERWEESLERHKREAAKMVDILANDAAMVAQYKEALGGQA